MIDLMYKVKSGVHYPLEDRVDFNRAYATYANNNKVPEEVEEIDEFVIFLDISGIFSDGLIDFSDLTKVLDAPPAPKQSIQFVPPGQQQGQG